MNQLSSTTVSLAVVAVIFLFANYCEADICPDHKMSCKRGQTCCSDGQGGYGCCPYENATCCSDGLHCCPEDTECDVSAGRCRRNGRPLKQAKLVRIPPVLSSLGFEAENEIDDTLTNVTVTENKRCPDQISTCPSTYTCCADPEGSYACCPFPEGTCCSDKIHCCPHGKQCRNFRCE